MHRFRSVCAATLGFVLLIADPVDAQISERWTVLTAARFGVVSYDSQTVARKSPGVYDAWLRTDVLSPDSIFSVDGRYERYSHYLTRYRLDCAGQRLATLATTYYDSIGNVLRSIERDSVKLVLVLPETMGEDFLSAFCRIRDGRKGVDRTAWLLRGGVQPMFATVTQGQRLRLASGVLESHLFSIDSTLISVAQRERLRSFYRYPLLRTLSGAGASIVLPELLPGEYFVSCEDHPRELLVVTVKVATPPRVSPAMTKRPDT